jgi:hypothetical protein
MANKRHKVKQLATKGELKACQIRHLRQLHSGKIADFASIGDLYFL